MPYVPSKRSKSSLKRKKWMRPWGEGLEASQGPAAKVVSEKIVDLIATLKAKAEGPLVRSAGLTSAPPIS
jgi:hypothetical protein